MTISRLPHAHADESGMRDMHCRFSSPPVTACDMPRSCQQGSPVEEPFLHSVIQGLGRCISTQCSARSIPELFLSHNASSTGIGG